MKTKILLVVICFAVATLVYAEQKKLWAKSFLGQPAPKLEVEKWMSAEPDTKGKFVLIDFWATWCPSCRKAIPKLNEFHKKFGDKLVIIGLSDETEAAMKKFTSTKIEYFSAIDTQARMKKAFEVEGIPNVFIVDPQGIVRWQGYPLLEGYELTEKVIQDILNHPSQTNAPPAAKQP